MKKNVSVVAGVFALVWGLVPGSVLAQDAVLAEFYGTGVHQYFSNNSSQAVSSLSAAIDGGSKDPRAYYFRALAELRMGNQSMAEADFQMGASLETADVNQYYPVAKSLERVQGASRKTIERYRSLARAEAAQRQRQRDTLRYEPLRRPETPLSRPQITLPPAPAIRQAPKALAPIAPATAEDPFAQDAEEGDKMPAAAEEPAEEMPAEELPTEEAPAEEMPAAEEPAAEEAPAEEAPATEEPALEGDDPFGDPPAKGEAKTEAPKPPEAAPVTPPAKEGDDPFADEPK